MLRFLFPRLTRPEEARGGALFASLVARARQPHWYRAGGIADSIDGRFATLSTLVALMTVRLEREGEAGEQASVALAERFVEAMDAEHRQLGLGDPTLGKTVRKLMGVLGKRVELWRGATAAGKWREAAAESLRIAEPEALAHCDRALRAFWDEIESAPVEDLASGRIA